jgi:predicted Zn-dependent peptidase
VLTRDRAEVMADNVPETAIDWSWAVPGRDAPESQALQMAARILGFGKTSRLYRALVHDKQIATYASASYAAHAIAGIFSVDVRLKPGVDRAVAEAAVKDVVQQFLADGPTADELERAKASAFADSARALESIYVRAMALADGAVFADDPGRYAKNDALFQALDASEVRTTASAWLTKPSYELTVLPYGTYQVAADGADRAGMPSLGPSPKLILPTLQHATLSNGIRVSLAPREGAPVVELTMVFDAGKAADQHMKPGLGDFTLGLMDEGTEALTAEEFADQEARLGARIYASSDVDTTTIALSALARSLDASVALWADYIRNPGFRAADLERDRALRLTALSQSLADPAAIAQRTFTNLIYGADHAYGVPLAHRAETLRSITLDDVAVFHDRWIRPDNAVIYAAGDTDLETLVPALEKAFGTWSAPAVPEGQKTLDPVTAQTAPRIVLIDKPGAIQSVIRVGQVMPSTTDPRTFDIEAMNAILGGNFTSRLNMNLREALGWTYGANSYVGEALGPSVFGVSTSVQTDKTAEALAEIHNEIAAIQEARPVTPDELQLMEKGEVLALPGRFETNRAMVGYLQYVARFDRPYDWITTLPTQYRALDPAAITEAAQMLHPDALTWVIVGDLAKIEDKVRALDLGPMEVRDPEGRRIR